MVHDGLREGLATSLTSQVGVETERLHDRKVSLDSEHWGSRPLFFCEDLATTTIEHTVDTTNGVFWALDFDKVDGFLERRFGKQASGVGDTSHNGDDLSTTTVDRVGVKLHEIYLSTSDIR